MKIFERKSEIGSKSLMFRSKPFFKNEYFQSRINFWLLFLSVIANIINWLIIFIFLRPATENIILHYNVYFGVDMTGKRESAYILPSVGLLIILINSLLSYFFYKNKEKIAGYILLISAFMVQLALIIAATSVIIINY